MNREIIKTTRVIKPLVVHQLPNYNLVGMRDELTAERLKKLSLTASKLAQKNVFGVFHSPDDYLSTLKLFLGSTQETRTAGLFIHRMILPMIKHKNNLLDVGFGNGVLTRWVASVFKKNIDIYETNARAIEDFTENNANLLKKTCLTSTNESIATAKLNSDYYDLCLLSHVLYYINKEKWLMIIDKIYKALKPGGYLFIAISGNKNDKAEILRNFSGKHIDTDYLLDNCQRNFGSQLTVYTTEDRVVANDNLTMRHIIGFLLNDIQVSVDSDTLQIYIDKNLKFGNLYTFKTSQIFVVIRKAGER